MNRLKELTLAAVKYSTLYKKSKKAVKKAKFTLKQRSSSRISSMTPEEAYEIIMKDYQKPVNDLDHIPRVKKRSCLVSVIVAAYNVEDYIEVCLDSILREIDGLKAEIIVTDDGSTDRTPDILKQYQKKYGIKLLHTQNGGCTHAQNAALEIASGKYLMFVDSDDYLLEGVMRHLLRLIRKEQADIACCNYIYFSDYAKTRGTKLESGVYTDFPDKCKVHGFAWGKLYHHKVFDDVKFLERYFFGDTINYWLNFKRCGKVVISNFYGYAYRENLNGSSLKKSRGTRCFDTLWIVSDLLDVRERLGIPVDGDDVVLFLRHMTEHSYHRLRDLNDRQKEAFFVYAAHMLETGGFPALQDPEWDEVYQMFVRRDFGMWKLYSEYACG